MKLKKRQIFFLLFLIAGTIYVAITNNENSGERMPKGTRKFSEKIFGTIMNVTYICHEDLHDTIMTCLQGVDASLSMFNPNSTISRINRNETDTLDEHLLNILPMALSISEDTDGAFDISIAPLVNAWGFGFKSHSLPTDAQVDSLRALVDYKSIGIENGLIKKQIPNMIIDLSAIAKGYGTDQVANLLTERGVKDFIVEIGGEIVCRGNNPKGEAWHVGISTPVEQHSLATNEVHEIIDIHDRAMATSGNYRNFYIDENGRKLSHTIDPKTGYPVRHGLLSSTVLAPSCAMADAYATSFMVMGLDKAKEIVTRNNNLQAYFIYTENDSTGKFQTWNNLELTQ
jgi:thiamine biosynthesis lipoprotein